MKKIKWVFLLLFIMIFGACQTKEVEEEMVIQKTFDISVEDFLYEEMTDIDRFTVDEEGYLYTIKCITELEEGAEIDASTYSSFIQQIKVYDLEGNFVKETEVALSTGMVNFITAKNGKLYCIAMKTVFEPFAWGPSLYEIDTNTWEVTELYFFENYDNILNFAQVGDYYYVIGTLKEVPEKEYTLHPNIDFYEYHGECVSRIKVGEGQAEEEIIPIDFPMDIVGTKKETLLIYHYNEEKGFGFFEFNPEKLTLTEVGWREKKDSIFNLVQCKDGFLCEKNGGIYYVTVDGIEVKLSKNDVFVMGHFVYQGGFLFYRVLEGIERICINDFIKSNIPVHMLLYDEFTKEPYDNGYQVEKSILEPENYTLKVLAQDSDFDMYVLESRNPVAYNIKEKGAFYALDEVEGVNEYLDACFPYIREAATNAEGDIWMIPIESTIFSLLYYKEYNEMQGVDLSSMDLAQFFALVEEIETNSPEKGAISTYVMIENLFWQYLSLYDSFDTDVFRSYMKQLKQIQDGAGTLTGDWYVTNVKRVRSIVDGKAYKQEELDQIQQFLYQMEVYVSSFLDTAERLGESDIIGVTNVPRLSEEIGNVGTVYFIAVNSNAKNLDVTLDYISDFCKYMVTQKDTFLLKDETLYTDTPIVKEYYEVYKEGQIVFSMEEEIYWDIIWDYLHGDIGLEETIEEMERKLRIYLGE